MSRAIKNVVMLKQGNQEGLTAYYKRFINTAEVAETQWGMLSPNKKSGKEEEKRNKFLTCVFLAGVDKKKYGRPVNDLNNAYLTGQNNYPTTVEGAVSMLSHYMNDKIPSEHNEGHSRAESSFAQNQSNIRCFKCNKMGHYASTCKENEDKGDTAKEKKIQNYNRSAWSG
jgi:hypothetical protein